MGLLLFTKVHLWADIWVFFCIFDGEELGVSTQGEWISFTQDRTNSPRLVAARMNDIFIAHLHFSVVGCSSIAVLNTWGLESCQCLEKFLTELLEDNSAATPSDHVCSTFKLSTKIQPRNPLLCGALELLIVLATDQNPNLFPLNRSLPTWTRRVSNLKTPPLPIHSPFHVHNSRSNSSTKKNVQPTLNGVLLNISTSTLIKAIPLPLTIIQRRLRISFFLPSCADQGGFLRVYTWSSLFGFLEVAFCSPSTPEDFDDKSQILSWLYFSGVLPF